MEDASVGHTIDRAIRTGPQGCESFFSIDFRYRTIGQFREGYLSFLIMLQSHLAISKERQEFRIFRSL